MNLNLILPKNCTLYADKKLSAYTLYADKKLSAYTQYANNNFEIDLGLNLAFLELCKGIFVATNNKPEKIDK